MPNDTQKPTANGGGTVEQEGLARPFGLPRWVSALLPTHDTIDTIMQCQAQRGIIELDYSDHEPGLYMFHAHQSEFAELGWMSFFEVV